MAVQANTRLEPGADPAKYEAGQCLVFRCIDPDEKEIPSIFSPGDVLTVLERNGCGMGIDCQRISDGVCDMVWPTEVALG